MCGLEKKNKVDVITKQDVYLTVPKRKKKLVKVILEYNSPIKAPINKGDKIGVLHVYKEGDLKETVDIISSESIKKSNIFSRILKSFNYLIWGDV